MAKKHASTTNGTSTTTDATSESTAERPAGLIDKRVRHRSEQPTPLGFVIPDSGHRGRSALSARMQAEGPAIPVTEAWWNDTAYRLLERLHNLLADHKPRASLPRPSLRTRLQLADPHAQRLDRYLRLGWSRPETSAGASNATNPTASRGSGGSVNGNSGAALPMLRTPTPKEAARKALNGAVLGWLTDEVSRLAAVQNSDAAKQYVRQLSRLAQNEHAIETRTRTAQPYHWTETQGRTAKGALAETYPDLADYVASCLAGQEVFPGLGPMRRIVSGDLSSNQAELMSEPIIISPRKQFSLVVSIRVFSFHGRPRPVVSVKYIRRVWAYGLKASAWGKATITGYALPDDSDQAIRFTLQRVKGEDGEKSHQLTRDFDPIARHYFPKGTPSVDTILQRGHLLPGCKLLIGVRNGVAMRARVKQGVPDLDKMDGFQRIRELVASIGLAPWQGLVRIVTGARSAADRHQWWDEQDEHKRQEWLGEIQDGLQTCYRGAHHLVIGVQGGAEADGELAKDLLERHLTKGWVTTVTMPIPDLAHGPKQQLPGKEIKDLADRAAERMRSWAGFIDRVQAYEARVGHHIDGVLIIARKWYGNQPDDLINKRAACRALATALNVPVQYLLPREETVAAPAASGPSPTGSDDGDDDDANEKDTIHDFQTRLMNAWLDLAFTTQGYVRLDKLQAAIARQLPRHQEAAAPDTEALHPASVLPDRILALSVVRRNKARNVANERSVVPCAIELDVATGLCTASFAYEDPTTHQLTWSEPPLPLAQALVALAKLGPVPLSSNKPTGPGTHARRKQELAERTQIFFKHRLADLARRSERPLVLIDADTSKAAWSWLNDENLNPDNVQLAGGYNAQVAWPHMQIVRLRTDNAPKVLWDNSYSGTNQDTQQSLSYHAPAWADAQLFKLIDTEGASSVYLSFGSYIRKGRAKGRSSYRTIPGAMKRISAKGPYNMRFREAILEPLTDSWDTPNGVEIVVVRSNSQDRDQIAALVESLRQSFLHIADWTTKPAPLYFDAMLKQYIADYTLDIDEVSGEDGDDEDRDSDSDDES